MADQFLCPNCRTDLSVRHPVAGCCPQCGRDLTVKLGRGPKARPAPPEGGLFDREQPPVPNEEVKPR